MARRDDLREVLDEAAKTRAGAVPHLRPLLQAAQAGNDLPDAPREFLGALVPLGERIRLRLPDGHAVLTTYETARAALGELQHATTSQDAWDKLELGVRSDARAIARCWRRPSTPVRERLSGARSLRWAAQSSGLTGVKLNQGLNYRNCSSPVRTQDIEMRKRSASRFGSLFDHEPKLCERSDVVRDGFNGHASRPRHACGGQFSAVAEFEQDVLTHRMTQGLRYSMREGSAHGWRVRAYGVLRQLE